MLALDESDVFISLNDLVDALSLLSSPEKQYFRREEKPVLENRQAIVKKCQQLGFKSQQEYFSNLVQSLNTLKQATDGDLGKNK